MTGPLPTGSLPATPPSASLPVPPCADGGGAGGAAGSAAAADASGAAEEDDALALAVEMAKQVLALGEAGDAAGGAPATLATALPPSAAAFTTDAVDLNLNGDAPPPLHGFPPPQRPWPIPSPPPLHAPFLASLPLPCKPAGHSVPRKPFHNAGTSDERRVTTEASDKRKAGRATSDDRAERRATTEPRDERRPSGATSDGGVGKRKSL